MKQDKVSEQLKDRIRRGEIRQQDVIRRLAELAFGRCNDCVRLVLEEVPEVKKLDLSLLSEVKRNEKGTVEIRLLDRLRILEQLAKLAEEDQGELGDFFRTLRDEEDQ